MLEYALSFFDGWTKYDFWFSGCGLLILGSWYWLYFSKSGDRWISKQVEEDMQDAKWTQEYCERNNIQRVKVEWWL